MSKKTTYIHAENNNKILSSNEVRLYVPPEPEKMKIIIWGKELCNVAEWNDFLKCVEEKTEENEQLKQQLKENDNYRLRYELAGADETIANLKHQLAEKDKEIEEKMMSFEKRCQEYYKSDEFKRDFAIQELEKVTDYAWFNYEKFRNYLNQQIKELKGE